MIRDNKLQQPVNLFEVNVEEYTESANAYYNCAEGYKMIGQTNKAIKCYEKSLVLNPDNENAKEMLRLLNN